MADQKYKSELENSEGKIIEVCDEDGNVWSGEVKNIKDMGGNHRLVNVRPGVASSENIPHDHPSDNPTITVRGDWLTVIYVDGEELDEKEVEELNVKRMTTEVMVEKIQQRPERILVTDSDANEFTASVTRVFESPARDEYDDAYIEVELAVDDIDEVPGVMMPTVGVYGTGGYESVMVHYYETADETRDIQVEELEVLE